MMNRHSMHGRCARGGAWAALVLLAAAGPLRAEVTTQQLNAQIDQLVRLISAQQGGDGSWSVTGGGLAQYKVGATSLGVLALLAARVPAGDQRIAKGAAWLARHDSPLVYEMSLRCIALSEADPLTYQKQIEQCASFLVQCQQNDGGWSYRRQTMRSDYSNSQFAVLGLRAAARVGVMIPVAVWRQAYDHYVKGQQTDGSWSYVRMPRGARGPATGSMTAAGVASVYICALQIHLAEGLCGQYRSDEPLRDGLRWLARNFSVVQNPGSGYWHFYYLYALERVGVIAARRQIGDHDWYREGVEYLVGRPQDFTRGANSEPAFLRQCFALMFLAKGGSPVVLQKAMWVGPWNVRRFDAEFLTQYAGYHFERPLSWQTVDVLSPLEDLLQAPILYVSGGGQPGWQDAHLRSMKAFMDQGGFMIVEAVNGNAEFDAAFRAAVARLYPDQKMVELPGDHPVYTSFVFIPEEKRIPLYGFNTGFCKRSPFIYSPGDLSCEWDIADFRHFHFQIGLNLIAYATGMEKLKEKLDPVVIRQPAVEEARAAGQGAFAVGEIVHTGFWHPHDKAWPRLLGELQRRANIDVVPRPRAIRLDEDDPFAAQLLFITGYHGFKLSAQSMESLRQYLKRGGFLFADDFCGSQEFDKAFRELCAQLFPDAPLKRLPVNHPLFRLGSALDKVRYRKPVLEKYPGLDEPYLEAVTVEDRIVIVYSKFDLFSAIDGLPCTEMMGVLDPDATNIAIKVVLYSLSH